jgi:hypothetical protein
MLIVAAEQCVIGLSGDCPNDLGEPIQGVTINSLPVMI